mmetsp:Transcript_12051/g.14662  ORF Transcript_12051/g.14662 Transcript_12051/m.14662 type:complete len:85 (+) Transcript_12051:410-664(+)
MAFFFCNNILLLLFCYYYLALMHPSKKRMNRHLGRQEHIQIDIYLDFGVNWCNTLRLYETLAPEDLKKKAWNVFGFEASPLKKK